MKKKELFLHPRAAPCGAQPGDASLMQNGAGQTQWRAGRQPAEHEVWEIKLKKEVFF